MERKWSRQEVAGSVLSIIPLTNGVCSIVLCVGHAWLRNSSIKLGLFSFMSVSLSFFLRADKGKIWFPLPLGYPLGYFHHALSLFIPSCEISITSASICSHRHLPKAKLISDEFIWKNHSHAPSVFRGLFQVRNEICLSLRKK